MTVRTRSQKMAESAFVRIDVPGKANKDYVGFAKKFPALIHTCGLAQAISFALAKGETAHLAYVDDLAAVLSESGHSQMTAQVFHERARTSPLSSYLRLSRDAIRAADWLKRYAEAAAGEDV